MVAWVSVWDSLTIIRSMITVIMDTILTTEVIITGAIILFITITGIHLSTSISDSDAMGLIITGDIMGIITITTIIIIMDTMITDIIIILIMIITVIIQTEINTREGIQVRMEDPPIIIIMDQEERTPQVTIRIV